MVANGCGRAQGSGGGGGGGASKPLAAFGVVTSPGFIVFSGSGAVDCRSAQLALWQLLDTIRLLLLLAWFYSNREGSCTSNCTTFD